MRVYAWTSLHVCIRVRVTNEEGRDEKVWSVENPTGGSRVDRRS